MSTTLLLLMLLGPSERPACKASTQGWYWPVEANGNPRLAQSLARDGLLEICVRTSWRHRWISPTIHVEQLVKRQAQRPSVSNAPTN